jgi:hypothetical protein
MAERFCTLEVIQRPPPLLHASFSAGPKIVNITGMPAGFDQASAEPSQDIEVVVCPVSNTPVLPPVINTPWMSSSSDRCRSKRVSVSRDGGW